MEVEGRPGWGKSRTAAPFLALRLTSSGCPPGSVTQRCGGGPDGAGRSPSPSASAVPGAVRGAVGTFATLLAFLARHVTARPRHSTLPPPPAAPPATYQRGEGPRAAGRERPLGLRLPEERRRGAQGGGRRLSSTPRCVYRHHVALPYLTKTSPVLRTVHRLAIFSLAPSTRRIHTNFLPKEESPKNGLQGMLASPSQLWRWLCRSIRWPRVSGTEGGCEESGSARCGEVQAGLRRRHRRSLCAPNSFQS